MRLFIRLLFGVIVGGMLAFGETSTALAHEGELHLGEGFVLTPLIIAIIGGTVAGFLLTGCLLWVWASCSLKRKEAQKRRLQSAGANTMTSESDDVKQEG